MSGTPPVTLTMQLVSGVWTVSIAHLPKHLSIPNPVTRHASERDAQDHIAILRRTLIYNKGVFEMVLIKHPALGGDPKRFTVSLRG